MYISFMSFGTVRFRCGKKSKIETWTICDGDYVLIYTAYPYVRTDRKNKSDLLHEIIESYNSFHSFEYDLTPGSDTKDPENFDAPYEKIKVMCDELAEKGFAPSDRVPLYGTPRFYPESTNFSDPNTYLSGFYIPTSLPSVHIVSFSMSGRGLGSQRSLYEGFWMYSFFDSVFGYFRNLVLNVEPILINDIKGLSPYEKDFPEDILRVIKSRCASSGEPPVIFPFDLEGAIRAFLSYSEKDLPKLSFLPLYYSRKHMRWQCEQVIKRVSK